MLLNINCVFWFSRQLSSQKFLIIRRTDRDMIRYYIGLQVNYTLCVSDFNRIWISLKYFRKHSNIKFHETPSSGSRAVPCGRTDRRKDMTEIMTYFRNFAKHALKYQGVATSSDKIHIISFRWIRKLLQSLQRDTHAGRNTDIMVSYVQGYRKRWTGFETAIT